MYIYIFKHVCVCVCVCFRIAPALPERNSCVSGGVSVLSWVCTLTDYHSCDDTNHFIRVGLSICTCLAKLPLLTTSRLA